MLLHKICGKHNVNSEVEPDKFYFDKRGYFYCLQCSKEERRRLYYLNNKEHVA